MPTDGLWRISSTARTFAIIFVSFITRRRGVACPFLQGCQAGDTSRNASIGIEDYAGRGDAGSSCSGLHTSNGRALAVATSSQSTLTIRFAGRSGLPSSNVVPEGSPPVSGACDPSNRLD